MTSGNIQSQEVQSHSRLSTTASGDPGDETERNFRYQHQYGVVLLAAVRRGKLNYIAIYCEHHEDFLAERPDGLFDAYQIKTSKPENGAWTLKSVPLTKSIGRFVDLMAAFPDQIGRFVFVSNSDVDSVTPASTDDKRRGRCPGLMLDHVKSCSDADAIQPPFRNTFDALAAELGADKTQLFEVLRRLETVKGPSREDFDAALAQEHIGGLTECAHLAPAPLRELCNNLVATFHRAASLFVVDPDRHLAKIPSGTTDNPVIAAKRIVIADVALAPMSTASDTFRYQGPPTISLGQLRPKRILEQKLERGEVGDLIDYMKAREQAAEYHFLEEQAKDSAWAARQLRQVEEAVHGECLESYMAHQTPGAPFGRAMFNDLSTRLRSLETQRRDLLGGAPYELLMGTAALLTHDCRVWWSDRFQVDGGEG
ncbi:dsDNA nuclease domain-containing protein [Asticcacaulis sp. W401b]|uniref:dsDNA nuclease domain-containing protein n=1 Tax=Asticcacaulis sp. W401b TaxID=3388666 RepID=UPI0039704FAA